MDNQIKSALRGDKQAQADCTAAGVLLPCPFCGGEAKLHESFKIIPVIDENGACVDADIENSPSWVYCTACNAAGQEFDVDENDEEKQFLSHTLPHFFFFHSLYVTEKEMFHRTIKKGPVLSSL
mgnify:CR=1 FL=1